MTVKPGLTVSTAEGGTMTDPTQDWTDADPFVVVEGAEETDGEFTLMEFTAHPSPDAPNAESDLAHARWAADGRDKHVNPKVEETFEVLRGEWNVIIEGEEHQLTEGDSVTIPGDIPHRHLNPGDKPTRVRYEARPACEMQPFLETFFTLAQAGKTDEGLPNILQLAVIQDAYPGHFYLANVPISVQKAFFKILAIIGRLAGYEPTYSREDIDELR